MAGTGARDQVRKVIDETLEAQNAGDAARLRSMLSERPDAVHIGTDAEEWDTSNQVVDAVAAAGGADLQAVADEFDIHIQGDVAWAEGRRRFTPLRGGARNRADALSARERAGRSHEGQSQRPCSRGAEQARSGRCRRARQQVAVAAHSGGYLLVTGTTVGHVAERVSNTTPLPRQDAPRRFGAGG